MKYKMLLLCSLLINAGLTVLLVMGKKNNKEIFADEKIEVTEDSSVIKIFSDDNALFLLMDRNNDKLIRFQYSLPDLSQSAAIETEDDNLQRVSYHGKDYTLTFIKWKENHDKPERNPQCLILYLILKLPALTSPSAMM